MSANRKRRLAWVAWRRACGVSAVAGVAAALFCSSCSKKPAKVEQPAADARPTSTEVAKPAPPKTSLPTALVTLRPTATEYGTRPDPEKIQSRSGPGVIDTTPVKPRNNAESFWPNAVKIVTELPPEDFGFPDGQRYESAQTKLFASEGFFVTGVGLWGRTRNMYHWVEYDIPEGAARFTGDVLVCDDPFGWFTSEKEFINQQFEFSVKVDGKDAFKPRGETRFRVRQGGGAKLMALDIPLPPDAKKIRFGLDLTKWGSGNKNVELVITDGMFLAAEN